MPLYLVEDMQTEEQIEHFFAENLKEAIDYVLVRADFKDYKDIISVRRGNRHNAYISIQLPYGVASYVFEVGEEGE